MDPRVIYLANLCPISLGFDSSSVYSRSLLEYCPG